ncbi:hypothetical protein GCM10011387_22040 [Pedobacter quisquiliarum]|uniref:Uncharacterized protein n=1 Tax=Pedobacter quisquiliarum TaxID=1834438 RepID=A0A916UCB5_9SPHI|nr:hypothetical protein GCM10011387_22040 [Pedobacter quisquiliarum]
MLKIVIITELVPDKDEDQNATRHPNGQARNIDKGVDFMFPQITPGDCKVKFEHSFSIYSCFNTAAGLA